MNDVKITAHTVYTPDKSMIDQVIQMRENKDENKPLHEVYQKLPVIDVHNHDAEQLDVTETRESDLSGSLKEVWKKYGIDRTVLFGNVSEPAAIKTDKLAWKYYQKYPDIIYPSFAGIPLDENKDGVEKVKEHLEQGYLNIGEIYVASTYSNNANVVWKGKHPYWGVLPEIYELAAEYEVPILLHIDPPKGESITYLKKALTNHPDTIFVFAHGNVFHSPTSMKALLKQHDNLYFDLFPGFTRYNKASEHTLSEYVHLIEEYPDRFFLGSDSGYEIGLENSYQAMYELMDLLTPETVVQIAYQNYKELIERQPPTETQTKKIKELTKELQLESATYKLNKREANELIFKLEKKKRGG